MDVSILEALFHDAQSIGLIGPAPVQTQISHSMRFCALVEERLKLSHLASKARLADLGSGAGIPGLVVAGMLPSLEVVLIDSMEKRSKFQQHAIQALGLDNCRSVNARAEDVGRSREFRTSFDLVTSRSFGKPAIVVECAAPLLRIPGYLIVSEPPEERSSRWSDSVIRRLGLSSSITPNSSLSPRMNVFEKISDTPAEFPRKVGIPAKRPLF